MLQPTIKPSLLQDAEKMLQCIEKNKDIKGCFENYSKDVDELKTAYTSASAAHKELENKCRNLVGFAELFNERIRESLRFVTYYVDMTELVQPLCSDLQVATLFDQQPDFMTSEQWFEFSLRFFDTLLLSTSLKDMLLTMFGIYDTTIQDVRNDIAEIKEEIKMYLAERPGLYAAHQKYETQSVVLAEVVHRLKVQCIHRFLDKPHILNQLGIDVTNLDKYEILMVKDSSITGMTPGGAEPVCKMVKDSSITRKEEKEDEKEEKKEGRKEETVELKE